MMGMYSMSASSNDFTMRSFEEALTRIQKRLSVYNN